VGAFYDSSCSRINIFSVCLAKCLFILDSLYKISNTKVSGFNAPSACSAVRRVHERVYMCARGGGNGALRTRARAYVRRGARGSERACVGGGADGCVPRHG
jgi:hypothetical protein